MMSLFEELESGGALTDARDIAWSGPAGRFKLRAAGIVLRGENVLVCRHENIDGCFLPGGKVQFGESAATALARELAEEIAVDFVVGTPSLVVDGIYAERGSISQEVCFYFRLDWPEGRAVEDPVLLSRDGQWLEWVALSELPKHGFLPPEILPLLPGGDSVEYVAFDRRTGRGRADAGGRVPGGPCAR